MNLDEMKARLAAAKNALPDCDEAALRARVQDRVRVMSQPGQRKTSPDACTVFMDTKQEFWTTY